MHGTRSYRLKQRFKPYAERVLCYVGRHRYAAIPPVPVNQTYIFECAWCGQQIEVGHHRTDVLYEPPRREIVASAKGYLARMLNGATQQKTEITPDEYDDYLARIKACQIPLEQVFELMQKNPDFARWFKATTERRR